MGARNKVISGIYEHREIAFGIKEDGLVIKKSALYGPLSNVPINKRTVKRYEILAETKETSTVGAVVRGSIGAALLGPIGLTAAIGAIGQGVHLIGVEFKDKTKCLIEINDPLYRAFMEEMY